MQIAVPAEIIEALNLSYGYILLIKGKAGTGKTTLALELLKSIENPLYVSTRIVPKYLYQQFPWIKQYLPKENIIDATAFDFGSHLPLTDEVSFLKSLKLQNLPDFMRVLFSKMSSKQAGTIVIDSWDAIAALGEAKWGKSTTLLANYLLELVREKNFNFVLVLEADRESNLDYLVDGIVSLEKSLFKDDKRVRFIHLNKLRGIEIPHPAYLFTLNEGKFTSFLPTTRADLIPPNKVISLPDSKSRFSSGISDLDQLLKGGFTKGNVILNEVGEYLGWVNGWFILQSALQFLHLNRCVIGVPPPGRDYSFEMNFTRKLIESDTFDKYYRLIEIGDPKSASLPYQIRINPTSHMDYFEKIIGTVDKLECSHSNPPSLFIISVNYPTLNYDLNELKRDTTQIISQMKQTGHIYYLTVDAGDPYIETLKNEVDYHFIIDQTDGCATFYAKNPKSNLFALNFENDTGLLKLKLIPIV